MTTIESTFDVVVVGGGVIGLSVAYEASRRQCRVLVIEKHRIGGGATDVAAGMIAPSAEAETAEEPLVKLALHSAASYPGFIDAVERDSQASCGYRAEGTLLVAADRDQLAALQHLAQAQLRLGLVVEPLTTAALRQLEGRLAPQLAGGMIARDDRRLDPRRFASALARAIRARSGELLVDATLRRVDGNDAALELCVTCRGEEQRFGAKALVVCAGVWSTEVLPELAPLPLRPVKGQILRLQGHDLLQHVVRSPGCYIVPRPDGELVIGSTMEEMGFDQRNTAGATLSLLTEACRLVPEIQELALGELAVGFRPCLRDSMPAIGAVGGDRHRVYCAIGHHRHGVLLAPATARYLVDLIASGRVPDAIAAFAPTRTALAPPRAGEEHNLCNN
jgi:glycine oxidase